MSDYRRGIERGSLYFFTQITAGREPVLIQPAIRQALRQAITDVRLHYPFDIHAWVLMPDHLHCIWQLPEHDRNFSRRWSMIKRRVSQNSGTVSTRTLSKHLRNESGLWQRRFWEHRLREDRDYQRHMDYVHYNPVKHGLVQAVADWPWSSFHRLVREGMYPADWGSLGGAEGEYGE